MSREEEWMIPRQDDGSLYPWWHYVLLPFVLLFHALFALLAIGFQLAVLGIVVFTIWVIVT